MMTTLYDLGMSAVPTETDTVLVELYSIGNTSSAFASAKAIIHNDGTAKVLYASNNDISGNPFWIAVKHRNSLQTWSKLPIDFTSNVSYNFSTALSQAYDDGFNPPMQDVGAGVYAIYGGDVNQDGTIDASDLADIDNDNAIFAFGYNTTDCTGDGASDASDLAVVDNNQNLFLFYAQP
jgi:hypothetical protein